jgi:hypothetical protein
MPRPETGFSGSFTPEKNQRGAAFFAVGLFIRFR